MRPTIFAVSSGRPPAAIAVLRISGPEAFGAARALAGDLPRDRVVGLRALRDADGALLDRALVLVFQGPATATGEDVVELHCHGGRAVVAAVGATLGALPSLRPALPGEFTRRALENGRIDLIEAEGLADLLEAETESQRVASLSAAEGRVSRRIHGWMEQIAELSARVEAMIDFSEEDDVDVVALPPLVDAAHDIASDIAAVLDAPPVERVRDGVRVVIAGPPNSGKSTLLNLLAERDAAIVSPVSGTTRDRIEAPVQRGGVAYVLTDTAGLRETDDTVEAIGIDRAAAAMAVADILVWLADTPPPDARALCLHGRADLPERRDGPAGRLAVSAFDAASVAGVWRAIEQRAGRLLPTLDQLPVKAAQRNDLGVVVALLRTVPRKDVLLLAEVLRQARTMLAALLGMDATEAALEALFSRFCIGK